MQHPNAQSPGTMLRLMIQAQLAAGWISSQFAEQALNAVAQLETQARLGQQMGALGLAATAPASVVAPTLPCTPTGTTNWGRHQQYCADGKPIEREKLSAAERAAKRQAESIGHTWGSGRRGRAA